MAPFVPFENGVQVELLFLLDNVVIENRLWFYTAGDPPGSTELRDLADGVYTWHTTHILPDLSDQLQLVTVVATDWSIPSGPFEVTTLPVTFGGVAEESHSANVAVVVRFRWAGQYPRQRKNKNYVPGVPLSQVNLNTPTAYIQNVLFEGYVALIDYARTISPGDYWYWVVASAILGNAPREQMLFSQTPGPVQRNAIILGQRRKRLPVV